MLTVKSVMIDKLVTIPDNATLHVAARLMKVSRVGSLLVQKGKKFTGILTEADIVRKAVAVNLPTDSRRAEEVMCSPLLSIEGDSPVVDAIGLMAKQSVRHLAVTENQTVIGIVSIRDVLQRDGLSGQSIQDLMSSTTFMIATASNVTEAAKLMKQHKIGSLLVSGRRKQPRAEQYFVGNRKEIIGILTETDIVRKVIAEDLNPLMTPVEKTMTRSLTVINTWKRTAKACDLLAQHLVRHLPVAEGDKIIGMLSVRDFIDPLHYTYGSLQYKELLRDRRSQRKEIPS